MREVESHRIVAGYDTFSQAHQDLFVLAVTNFMRSGSYLEVGASEPKQSNNTYLLESRYGWEGASIEIDPQLCVEFNKIRRNECVLADATQFDFLSYLSANAQNDRINYLSLDIDPSSVTLAALRRIPLDRFRFDVVTFEHDLYASGPGVMKESREIFEFYGYKRVVSNVMCRGRDFEDWYVDPTVISEGVWMPFLATKIECAQIFTCLSQRGK
jgi:hypothetical protein